MSASSASSSKQSAAADKPPITSSDSTSKQPSAADGKQPMKYVIVTGSVVSGIGKGITSSSIGVLLQASGLVVTSIKVDPYLNYDASLLSPSEHGECFVLNDGGETDLDLGNYERFLDNGYMTANHNITAGKIYRQLHEAERRGDFLGKTVQTTPHATTAVVDWLKRVSLIPTNGKTGADATVADVCLVELGGTVGDVETVLFLEALRQLQYDVGTSNVAVVHVSLVPSVGASAEQKTKPVQNGVRELRHAGLTPDFVACRSESVLGNDARKKIANFAMVDPANVLSLYNVGNIYEVPILLRDQRLAPRLLQRLGLPIPVTPDAVWNGPLLAEWQALAAAIDDPKRPVVSIAVIGKYVHANDAYLSLSHALRHAAMAVGCRIQIDWIDSELLESTVCPTTTDDDAKKSASFTGTIPPVSSSKPSSASSSSTSIPPKMTSAAAWTAVRSANGVLVPGGFGPRGTEGMINAIRTARLGRIPFLGICFGLQLAVVEFCRSELAIPTATSTEFDTTAVPYKPADAVKTDAKTASASAAADTKQAVAVVAMMLEKKSAGLGGTMRCGLRRTNIAAGSVASKTYNNQPTVDERHRHRYEVVPAVVDRLKTTALTVTGTAEPYGDDRQLRCEIVELPTAVHPFFLAVQFHPEYLSRPFRPSPPFFSLLTAAYQRQRAASSKPS